MKHIFQWTGITLQGKNAQGEIAAESSLIAKQLLQHQSILFLKIQRKKSASFTLFKRSISQTDMAQFYRQLGTLICAGIPLVQSCYIILQNQTHELFNHLILTIKMELEKGQNLSVSLHKHPRYFDNLTCHLIKIAEYTGTLDKMLLRISTHKEKMLALKNKIKQALLYPSIISVAAIIVTMTLLMFVVPQFTELFQSLHGQLPSATVRIIQLSNFIRDYYWLTFLPLPVSMIFVFYYKKSLSLKKRADYILLKIPILGNLLHKFILARFARTLSTILAAGVPIQDALKLLLDIHDNEVYKNAIQRLQTSIAAGQQLHYAILSARIFPSMMTQMIRVGEESGALEQMLEKTAEFYESEMDYWITYFSQLLEPLIIVILGVLIGGLVIAMYLPIFKLGTVF
jgi:type IV pilus assembly protein PilC